MKITGIITEYNPFHNGHLYHLNRSKNLNKNQGIICVMNGNFMQRGQPAVTDKWSRTKMALENGVDLVIELPLIYGIRSAEYFASGAIKTLAATGVVSSIVFGSETGKIEPLKQIAEILIKEPNSYSKKLKENLNKGDSFPVAREKALIYYLDHSSGINKINKSDIINTISQPNNILGIEYLKTILKLNLPVKSFTIKRTHKNYHSKKATHKLASATAIRELIYQNKIKEIKNLIPDNCYNIIESDFNTGKIPIKKQFLGNMILSKLRQLSPDNLKKYAEINNGLENRIISASHKSGNLEKLISSIKTKNYTRTRIQRNLLHILFSLKNYDLKKMDSSGIKYLRVLGFNTRGEKILSRINSRSSRPIITQPADFLKSINCKSNNPLIKQLSYDILASDVYTLLYSQRNQRNGQQDFLRPVIKV